jgi:hypothetical protein
LPTIFEAAGFVRHHYHGIKYNGQNLDIKCPGYNLADIGYVVVIPWYLNPGRPYPVQVYQFACSYYGSNPNVGQRGAAEATRIKFDLKTFSHSTVSRSFKSFENSRKMALEKRYGKEVKINGAGDFVIVMPVLKDAIKDDKDADTDISEKSQSERRFPSVNDTAERRMMMTEFLPGFENGSELADIEAVACDFVTDWHKKFRRLLL